MNSRQSLIKETTRYFKQQSLFENEWFMTLPDIKPGAIHTLDQLFVQIKDCQKCPLGSTRTNFVFGAGNPNAEVVFIGEAPGRDEDLQGEPFVGRAGQLLNKVLESISLSRESVYICNILKCRPPENRDPTSQETATCIPYLELQLRIIHPKVIVALGRVAAQYLLNTTAPIGRLRGKTYKRGPSILLVTYHTAALLRNPNLKIDTWNDMKLLRSILDDKENFTVSPAKKNTPNKPVTAPDAGQRVPPQAMELEIAVLGAIMLDSEAMWKVVDVIDDSCFYTAKHRKIFRAMKSLFDKQEPYDLLTVIEELKKQKQLENIGGAYYLGEILASVPTAANAEYHARVIREKSLLRNLISVSADISSECYDPSCEAEAVMEKMQSQLFQLVSAHQERRVFGQIKPFLSETFETIETYHKKKGLVTGIGTGYHALDEKTAGFQNSDLIILAARPAMGKTSLALNLARNAAIEHNVPVGLFSLEMTSQQLSLRLLCSEARVNSHLVRTGRLPDSDWQKLSKTVGKLAKAPIYLDDTASIGVLDIRTRARRAKLEHNIGMIFIDYLQLMELPRGAESQQQGIAQISRSFKALAKELNIPVIAVSQLSRAVEVRGGKRRPQLSDLRDSGAIEQDADLVLFIYRPEYYGIQTVESEDGQKYSSEGLAEIIIGKNRNGPPGSVLLQFEKTYVRFQDLEMKRQLIPIAEDEEIQTSEDTPF